MKRLLATAICLSLLYASAVWAFAGCENLTVASSSHHDDGQNGAHHHHDSSAPDHSEGGRIHCANLLGGFVASSKITPETERRAVASLVYRGLDLGSESAHSATTHFVFGPPGGLAAHSLPLYLLLSVIRI